MCAVVESPFDRLAPDYDALWTHSPAGSWQRAAVWKTIAPHFRPCRQIVDLGCGTGTDARFLETLGIRVFAIDSSPAMVRAALKQGIDAHCCHLENIGRLPFHFEGALSNFGALNCIESLADFNDALSRVLEKGSPVALCFLGRVCLWELAYYLLRGKFRKAFRRFRGRAYSSIGLTVYYPSHAAVLAAFRDRYRLIQWQGIGFFVPPSYVPIRRKMAKYLAFLDRLLAAFPVFRACADHRLYLFQRL